MQRHRSVRNLATVCGISPSRLAALEEGRLDPELELLAALARGIGVRPSEIYLRADQLAAADSGGPPGEQAR